MALLQEKHIADAVSATKAQSVMYLDHERKFVADVPFEDAKLFILTGMFLVGGSRSRVKYIQAKEAFAMPVRVTPDCPIYQRTRREYHELNRQSEMPVLSVSIDWLKHMGYRIQMGMGA